ncbi:MAG: HD domain-containing phosphohydrolase [bacterium]
MENQEGLCRAMREEGLIIRLLDGELQPTEEHRVLTHLRICHECLGLAADLLYADGKLKELFRQDERHQTNQKKNSKTQFMLEVDKLPVGKTLERDLLDESGELLIASGTELTESVVEALKRRGIEKLAVRTDVEVEEEGEQSIEIPLVHLSEIADIIKSSEIEPAVSDYVRNQCISMVKDSFRQLEEGGALAVHEVQESALTVADEILARPQVSLTLADLSLADPGLHAHSVNVLTMFLIAAKAMGHPAQLIRDHATAVLLHDIGRIVLRRTATVSGIPRTTENEDSEHPEAGYAYLWNMGGFGQSALKMVMNHHERFDGKGYPRSLKGTNLSDWDQLLILANTFDVLTWNRTTGLRSGFHNALSLIIQDGAKYVRKGIIRAVIQTFGHYPPGSWVHMNTGEIGIVLKAHSGSPLKPLVSVMFDGSGKRLSKTKMIDLLHAQSAYINGSVNVAITL